MTDEQTLKRLMRDFDQMSGKVADLSEWKQHIDVERAAEAERWKTAVGSIKGIEEELKAQGKEQKENHKTNMKLVFWGFGLIAVPVVGAFMNFVIKGGLGG